MNDAQLVGERIAPDLFSEKGDGTAWQGRVF